MFLLKFVSRRWWFATLLVIAATLTMIRLGIWQLDRLEQRRAFNAQVEAARAQPPLDLNATSASDLTGMEWRAVEVTGEYDFANQVAIRNQYYLTQPGYHLMTPLLFDGQAVLVDRGWIPAEGNDSPEAWRTYDEPGLVRVTGQIRLGQSKPALGGVADAPPADGSRLAVWNNADVGQIARQLPYPVPAVYVQPDPDPADAEPPIPFQPELELTEGPHFGYALQWFTFAAILFFGYPFFVRKQESGSA
jgi:surfeit locus 1 family protein